MTAAARRGAAATKTIHSNRRNQERLKRSRPPASRSLARTQPEGGRGRANEGIEIARHLRPRSAVIPILPLYSAVAVNIVSLAKHLRAGRE